MALSGSLPTVNIGNSYMQYMVDWSATQNISANTSTLTIKHYLKIVSGSGSVSAKTGTDSGGGSSANWSSPAINLSGTKTLNLGSSTMIVSHDSSGTKSFTLTSKWFPNAYLNGATRSEISTSGTVSLNTIPRYAKITSWSLGSAGYDRFTISRSTDKAISETQYRLNGGTWYVMPSNGIITGLSPGTTYRVQISVKATDSGLWTNSGEKSITTTALPRITSFSTSGVQLDRFTVNFATSGSVGYRERSLNGGTWTSVSNGTVLSGLSPNTNYTIRIRVRPSDFGTWTYSNTLNVGTVRLSTATISNKYLDETIPVTVSRANSNITHTVRLYAWADNQTNRLITTKTGVTTSVNITLTEVEKDSVLANRVNTNNTTYYVSVESHWSGSQGTVNSSAATMTFRNINPNVGTLTYKDVNALALSLTNNNQNIVQSKSEIMANISSVNALKYSTIRNVSLKVSNLNRQYNYSVSSLSGVDFNLGAITADRNTTLTITVTDSRGFVSSKSVSVNVIPYSSPNFISYDSVRESGYEDDSFISYVVRLSKSIQGTETIRFRTKELPSGTWSNYANLTPDSTKDIVDIFEITSTNQSIGAYNNRKDFSVELNVIDHFGNYGQVMTLQAGSGLAIIDENGLAFKEQIRFDEGLRSDGGYYTGDDLFHKGYINIPQNGNLNNYTEPGWYSTGTTANSATIANHPSKKASIVEVLPNYTTVNITQRLTDFDTGDMFWRTRYAGTWYQWVKVAKDGHQIEAKGINLREKPLVIYGTAADQMLLTRGISGSDGLGKAGDLYLNHGTTNKVYINGNEASVVGHTHAASAINSGTLGTNRIPNLPASKITSGTFDAARIPDYPISTGTITGAGGHAVNEMYVQKRGGIVLLNGIVRGVFPQNTYTSVASLPVGYRPTQTIYAAGGGTGGNAGLVTVSTTGAVQVNHRTGTTNLTWMSFNIMFFI